MAEGDLIRTLFPESEPEPRPSRVTKRRRSPEGGGNGAKGLRPLPRARGELDLVDVRDPLISFEDLILRKGTRQLFGELHLELNREDFLVAHGVPPRRTFLFVGPPGCGKSATAEALADELGRQFATVNLSTVVSSFLGDTAKNLSAIFEAAAAEPWVVLFDEFDAIGKERADRTDHGELKRVVTSFLQKLDAFRGPSVLVAATNHPGLLDLAVWRRFDEVLSFEYPTIAEIKKLLRLRLSPIRTQSRLSVEKLASASKGLPHAEICRAVTDAYRTQLLMESDKPLTLGLLLESIDAAQTRRAIGQVGGTSPS